MPRKRSGQPLTQRQQERIRQRVRNGRDATTAGLDESGGEPGLVTAHFGLNMEVEGEDGARCRCAVRETLEEEPVCGDRVVWQRVGEGQGVVVDVEPRRTVLRRPGPYQRLLTVAANVDRIVVVAASGGVNPGLLDRYLAAAEKAGIEALLVVNKSDLSPGPEEEALTAPYARMGYPVLRLSALRGTGLDPLLELLRDKTSVFVGESGVGKSSLVGRWTDGEVLRTAEVHAATGQGRHATTTSRMYRLASGGWLIDSPGVREFGLFGVERESVAHLFRDMMPFLGRCRFNDCRHAADPGCALRAAVERGAVSPARLASLLRIMESLPSRNPHYG